MIIQFISSRWEAFGNRYWGKVEDKCEQDESCRFMRNALNAIAKEYEDLSYASLLQSAEALSTSRTIDGITLHFSEEAYRVELGGDIHVCIDVIGLTTQTWWKPSYRFVKQQDGSVYYSLQEGMQ